MFRSTWNTVFSVNQWKSCVTGKCVYCKVCPLLTFFNHMAGCFIVLIRTMRTPVWRTELWKCFVWRTSASAWLDWDMCSVLISVAQLQPGCIMSCVLATSITHQWQWAVAINEQSCMVLLKYDKGGFRGPYDWFYHHDLCKQTPNKVYGEGK